MGVYRRGTVWYYDICVNGTREKRATKAQTRREAEVEAAKAMERMARNSSASSMTLKTAITRCYIEKWSHGKDGERMYSRAMKIVELVGDIPVRDVDEKVVSDLSSQLQGKGLSQASINRYKSYLRRVLNVACKEWKAIPSVPYIKNAKEPLKRFKVYTPEEEAQFLSNAPPKLQTLLFLLIYTGMRVSEALRLKMADIDFDTNMILVWESKNDKPRGIPMPAKLRAILAVHRKYYGGDPDRSIVGMTLDETEREWKRLKKKLGVTEPGCVLHAFRHTYASRLVQRGVDLYSVKELLGHSTFRVTERYAHLNNEKLASAVKVLDGGVAEGNSCGTSGEDDLSK